MTSNFLRGIDPLYQMIAIVLIMLTQGITLFVLAKKRERKAWVWGLIGLIQFPMPSILYYFIVVRPMKKQEK